MDADFERLMMQQAQGRQGQQGARGDGTVPDKYVTSLFTVVNMVNIGQR